jgi:uncharacterized protein (DUF1501 family)
MGGFDNHANQLNYHGSLLTAVSDAMAALYSATEELGIADRVTSFTESEFGRSLQPNTALGTDHAWGGHCFVLGGSVIGGKTYGKYPELALEGPDDSGNRGSWIPTTSQDQYAATLAAWFGVTPADISAIFPNLSNFSTPNLGFARTLA